MQDRVDPLGGWFDLGDRDFTQLPDTARVTQPRVAESAGMSPRAGQLIERRISPVSFVSGDENLSFGLHRYDSPTGVTVLTGVPAAYNPAGAGGPELTAVHEILDFEPGDKIVGISMTSRRKDNSGNYLLTAILFQTNSVGGNVPVGTTSLVSTSNGTITADAITFDPTDVTTQVNLTLYTYFIVVNFLNLSGAIAQSDIRLFNFTYKYVRHS